MVGVSHGTGAPPATTPDNVDLRDLITAVSRFQTPRAAKSVVQAAVSFGCFLATCTAMYLAADISCWIALALAPLAAGFLVRIFIIQHDCGHGAFFASKRWNDVLGFACSLFTLAPYASWRRQHAGHHGVWNDLDRRQSGVDIYSTCLTLAEYRALGSWGRRWYRITRHPLMSNVVIPPLVFFLLYRLPFDMPKAWRRERRAVHLTNLAIAGLAIGTGLWAGFGRVALVQAPIMVFASVIGVWLFTVQHRFERAAWIRHDRWSIEAAALRSSSHLRLPRVLQWFSGNIGLHHVHHLNPRVPNYLLQRCHESIPALWSAPSLTLREAFHAVRFILWDEDRQAMVTVRTATAPDAR
jgi:omega-6 fatty acid desaturase (delta-12 desaturase)